MTLKAPEPVPQAPARITPTLLTSFSACPARAGFERNPLTAPLRRIGLRAALGVVSHRMLERKGTGVGFPDTWDQEVNEVYDQLCKEWAPATPPSPSNWPGWALTRARIAQEWPNPAPGATPSAVSHNGTPKHGNHYPAQPGPLPWREQWLEDPKTGLAGRPDLVDRLDGVLRVIDFKTGVGQGDASEQQRQQLLFYCALVRRVLGELPSLAAIQDAAGGLHPVEFSLDEVVTVEQQAVEAFRSLKEASAQHLPLDARPSEDSCPTCPFRLLCGAFLGAYGPDWPCGHVRLGTIRAVSLLGEHRAVDIDVRAPAWGPRAMRLIAFPFPKDVAPGEVWGFSDFEGPSSTGTARWNTLVFRWPDPV